MLDARAAVDVSGMLDVSGRLDVSGLLDARSMWLLRYEHILKCLSILIFEIAIVV